MPTYIRPARVDITEGGCRLPWGLIGGLAATVVVGLFVAAHLEEIAIGLTVAAVVTVTAVGLLYRHAPLAYWAPQRSRAINATVTAQAIPVSSHPAIEGGQHVHIHVTDEAAAAELVAAIRGSQSWSA
jgi:hypothetical protein